MVEANKPLADASTSTRSASPASPAALGPERWRSDMDRLKGTTFDVVVVGGGIVGAGVALDAVTRGLSVGVVEAQDWASGTSSRSSKLIHGGLRYLQMRDFALVREALRERSILLRTAPHLVQPIRFLYPLRHRIWERAYVGAGIALYDLLARTQGQRPSLPRHRQLSRRRTHELVPSLKGESFVGAVSYYDAQVDDARHTMSVMRTAASAGAAVVNRVKAIGLAEESSRVTGVRVRAVESGEEFTISAKVVISATGVWTEEFEGLAGRGRAMRLEPSKGVHLVLPRRCIDSDAALILQTEKSVLFVLPWRGDHWIVGTTDTPWRFGLARPSACREDVQYLLDTLNGVLRTPVSISDIESVYVGLRPLIAGAEDQTTKLSREHAVNRPIPGLVLVSGGKYTTYRAMAKDVVDVAVKEESISAAPSLTERYLVVGADGFERAWSDRIRLAKEANLTQPQYERLLCRYGTLVGEVLESSKDDPSALEEISGSGGYLRAEVTYAVTHEGARHLDDVLVRRTRIAMETPDRGTGCALEVAMLMGRHLGWDQETLDAEVASYGKEVAGEVQAEAQVDESVANEIIRKVRPRFELA